MRITHNVILNVGGTLPELVRCWIGKVMNILYLKGLRVMLQHIGAHLLGCGQHARHTPADVIWKWCHVIKLLSRYFKSLRLYRWHVNCMQIDDLIESVLRVI